MRLRVFHRDHAPLLIPEQYCTTINLPTVNIVVVPYERCNVVKADLDQFIGRVTRYGKDVQTTVLYLSDTSP